LPGGHRSRHTIAGFDALSKPQRTPSDGHSEIDVATESITTTGTLGQARAHARAQADAATASITIPSTSASALPEGVAAADVLWDEVIETGGYASRPLSRSSVLRIADVDGEGCVQLLVFDRANPVERLNVADTVKVQWQAYLGPGALLLSDMGRVLMTMIADTSARHDSLCGGSTPSGNAARYGDGGPSGPTPSARDLLVLGATKLGLSRRDVGPNVNLFKAARVEPDGSLVLDGESAPGRYVDLRAETGVLVVLANTPHPLDDRTSYTGSSVRVTAWRATHPDPEADPLRSSSPERRRAFLNADELLRMAPS
jgi:urea carboxylase-associated protein 2